MPKESSLPGDRVAEALFGRTRRAVLALLFGRPNESFYLRQIARETGAGTGAVQRELSRLVAAGLVQRIPQGSQVHFSADRASPVHHELRSLMAKTAGVADVLRAALAELAGKGQILLAFIYGSVAAGSHNSESDIDVMILGNLRLAELLPRLSKIQHDLGREVNPTIYAASLFALKFRKRDHFIRRTVERPKIMLIGSSDDLEKLVRHRVAPRA